MKKHKNSQQPVKKKSKGAAEPQQPADHGRRRLLRRARNWAIGLSTVAGVGFLFVQNVRSSIHERDLSRIGNGTPTIVQIHDPQCALCRSLQRETRQALNQFEENELDYVVANIKTTEGSKFAIQYAVPHVTLLLFDKSGELKTTLRGQRQSEELGIAFRQLVRR